MCRFFLFYSLDFPLIAPWSCWKYIEASPLLHSYLTSLLSSVATRPPPSCSLLPPSLSSPHIPLAPQPISCQAPGFYFLFVLAQGATCPERPTAWSLPAVSAWHSLACRAGLHLRRPTVGAYIHRSVLALAVHTNTHARAHTHTHTHHLPSTTTGHEVMWCKMINELV